MRSLKHPKIFALTGNLATDTAIDEVTNIAESRALPSSIATDAQCDEWQAKGFLVSAYDRQKYKDLAKRGRLFVALSPDSVIGAFSVVYMPGDAIDHSDLGSQFINERFGAVPIIKQIATAIPFEGKGYSSALYEYFIIKNHGSSVFAAIVEEPRNFRSENFHTRMGFTRVAVFNHPDGKPRGIWKKD